MQKWSVVIFFVRAFSFKYDIARDAIICGESKFRFVEAIFLGPKVNVDFLWQIHFLFIAFANWWDMQTFWDFS